VVRAVSALASAAAAVLLVTHLDVRPVWLSAQVATNVAPPAKPAADPHKLTVRDGKGALALDDEEVRLVQRGMMLRPGIELVAPQSGVVQIGTAQGTLLTLEPGGTLTVTESAATQRFALLRGAVRARVAKLAPGERFLINSADAEIEVHGTQFRVALVEADPGCAVKSLTRVSVTEGVVSVRSGGQEVRLHPGEQWPAGCTGVDHAPQAAPAAPVYPIRVAPRTRRVATAARAVAAAPAEAPRAEETVAPVTPPAQAAVALPVTPATAPVVRAPVVVAPPAMPQSQLAAQNDLFAAALRAKRAGRDTEAIRYFTRLVRRYPNGPNTEAALVQRMRLLAAGDPDAGADAALEYISVFPDGFARAEADRLAAHAVANKP
jgi:hypothetical protein